MSRSVFGWDLPLGVTHRMIEEQCADHPCEICGEFPDNCICPECPVCGTCGDPECYEKHGLKVTPEQSLLHDWNEALQEEEYRADCEFFKDAP